VIQTLISIEEFARGILFILLGVVVFAPYYAIIIAVAMLTPRFLRKKVQKSLPWLLSLPLRFYRFFGTPKIQRRVGRVLQTMQKESENESN
jgi:hypothetical protein